MSHRLILGDALEVLPTLEAESADTILTDPPYGISFMGKGWDHGVPGVPFWEACLRVAKPGTFLLAFGGTRTFHRLTCALEDAGWEIRDTLCWLYGQGFPKSKSCMKPAWEPIILAMKKAPRVPPLNISGSRIPTVPRTTHADGNHRTRLCNDTSVPMRMKPHNAQPGAAGRWPANVVLSHRPECMRRGTKRVKGGPAPYKRGANADSHIYGAGCGREVAGQEPTTYAAADGTETVEDWTCHPECPVRLLDEQSGERPSGGGKRRPREWQSVNAYGFSRSANGASNYTRTAGTGRASRFFYCPKASKAERGQGNNHPCVKPLTLLRWLCTLTATPEGGTVLDPFAGSGSTGVACLQTGRRFIGIELSPAYHAIATRRLKEATAQLTPARKVA